MFRKRLSTITKQFNDTIAALDKLIEANHKEVSGRAQSVESIKSKAQRQIDAHLGAVLELNAESNEAAAIRSKIAALVSA